MVGNLKVHQAPSSILNFLNTRIAKLYNISTLQTNEMVVLATFECLFKLSQIFPKLMLCNQPALKKQLDGIIQGSPANTVVVSFHVDIKRFHIKVPLAHVNLL